MPASSENRWSGPFGAEAVTAMAPASVGNVAVGFDLLGHAVEGLADRVRLTRRPAGAGPEIGTITGAAGLPRAIERNTAGRAAIAFCQAQGIAADLRIDIAKGIPLSAGLGGSAASAVAAVTAANALFGTGHCAERLYPYALAGEAVASGAAHGDNVGSQLLGGLVLATAERLVPVPVPTGLTAAIVHPALKIDTRDARQCLEAPFGLEDIVAQTGHLALVLSGCQRGDFMLIRAGLRDRLIEPRRSGSIPGFAHVQHAALDAGALGASISGAGPSVFAWFERRDLAEAGGAAMRRAFNEAGLAADTVISSVDAPGARVVEHLPAVPA